MLKYNGGFVPVEKEYVIDFGDSEVLLGSFFPIKYRTGNIERYYQSKHEFLYPNLLSIGTLVGGYIAMGYQSNNFGQIYIYFSDEESKKIANSFTDFF
ncbi:SMI1/KNR4 family protein [Chryseobacterium gambrini]|nr:SMI1/KNR4 family protein [Chryseobacterium gambrini]WBV51084.1 SMI1/KNR4 family protein [Chryseobacterium gambrini]